MGRIVDEIVNNPRTSIATVVTTNFSNWWLEWGSPVVSAMASVLGVILLVVLIRYHLENLRRLIRENKDDENKREEVMLEYHRQQTKKEEEAREKEKKKHVKS